MIISPEMKDILKEHGISPHTFHKRIRMGWDVETALTKAIKDERARDYCVVKNGKLLDVLSGITTVAKFITGDVVKHHGEGYLVTKNMILGRIRRAGIALFQVGEDRYGVGEKETGE